MFDFNWLKWLPESVSTYGKDIDSITALISLLVLIWFFLMMGTILFFLVKYRRRPGVKAAYIQGEKMNEMGWILLIVGVILVLDLWIDERSTPVWARVKQQLPESPLTIQVTAKQFNWGIRYAGPDGRFGTDDDLTLDNEIHVPVHQPIRVELQSVDVLHSFFLPNLRLKQDVVPGRTINAWFEVTKPGQYELVCAELCGFGHSGMKGYLFAHTPEEYDAWVKEQWPPQEPAGQEPAAQAAPGDRTDA